MNFFHLYDCITRKDIKIYKNGLVSQCNQLGIDYTCLYKLGKSIDYIQHRYILDDRKDLITVLENIDTGEKYECVSNKTIFIHLGLEYNGIEAKYVSAIRLGKQSLASICGSVYRVPGFDPKRVRRMKNKSVTVNDKLELQKIQRNIKNRLHNRIRHAIDKNSMISKKNLTNFLGCTNEFLYKFIESKFTGKMNWGNKDLWHIDHIIPCSEFDLTDINNQKKCFHYTNLQPIWATSKIAIKMGELPTYSGNQNKSSSGLQYDYKLEEVIRLKWPELDSVFISAGLCKLGVRKVAGNNGRGERKRNGRYSLGVGLSVC